MSDSKRNSQIEKIASLIISDKTLLDEQNPKKLQRYYDFVKTNYNLAGEQAIQLVKRPFCI